MELFAELIKRSRPLLVSVSLVCYTIPIPNVDSNEVNLELSLSTAKEMSWEAKHNPVIRSKCIVFNHDLLAFTYLLNQQSQVHQSYDTLLQRFWRQYLEQYGTNNTNALSNLEPMPMLDSPSPCSSYATARNRTKTRTSRHVSKLSSEGQIAQGRGWAWTTQ